MQFSPNYFSGLSESSVGQLLQRQLLKANWLPYVCWNLPFIFLSTLKPLHSTTERSYSKCKSDLPSMAFWSIWDKVKILTRPSPCSALPACEHFSLLGHLAQDPHAPSPRTLPPSLITVPSTPCSQILLIPHVAVVTLPKTSLLMPSHKWGKLLLIGSHQTLTLPFTALTTPSPFVSTRLEA